MQQKKKTGKRLTDFRLDCISTCDLNCVGVFVGRHAHRRLRHLMHDALTHSRVELGRVHLVVVGVGNENVETVRDDHIGALAKARRRLTLVRRDGALKRLRDHVGHCGRARLAPRARARDRRFDGGNRAGIGTVAEIGQSTGTRRTENRATARAKLRHFADFDRRCRFRPQSPKPSFALGR